MENLEVPENLGVQLVGILYKNTNLNYDVCALNLVEIFQHLASKIPQLENVSSNVITTIQVIYLSWLLLIIQFECFICLNKQESICDKTLNPDLTALESILKDLNDLSNTLKCGELNFYECNETIVQNTEKCIELLVMIA